MYLIIIPELNQPIFLIAIKIKTDGENPSVFLCILPIDFWRHAHGPGAPNFALVR